MSFRELVEAEKVKSRTKFGNNLFNSLHEAYAVLLEEVEEFWDIVKQKPTDRMSECLLEELVQITATSELIAETFIIINEKQSQEEENKIKILKEMLVTTILGKEVQRIKNGTKFKYQISLEEPDAAFIQQCKTILR